MIDFTLTRITNQQERPVASGSTIVAEGSALVIDTTSSVFGVKPSAATSGELFCGISVSQQLTITAFPNVETGALSGLVYVLAFTPVGGTAAMRVFNVTRSAVIAAGGGAGQYGLAGATITVVTGGTTIAGDTITVYYRYTPTTVQALGIQGNIPPGGAAGLTLNSVGVAERGDVLTSEYDASVDWTATNVVVKTGASGLFTIGGTGTSIAGYVIQVPTATSAFLGLHIEQ